MTGRKITAFLCLADNCHEPLFLTSNCHDTLFLLSVYVAGITIVTGGNAVVSLDVKMKSTDIPAGINLVLFLNKRADAHG
jgi:hypothetical protein